MQQRAKPWDLAYTKAHLKKPQAYSRCTHPVSVQKLIKEISSGMLDINVIDREGNKMPYKIPVSFLDDKMHSFYEVHRQGTPIGRLYFTGIHIYDTNTVKEALEMIIDEAMIAPMNGHAKEISFYKKNKNEHYSQIGTRPLKNITLGRILE